MFSLDAWHEPFVPPERVARAVRISEALGGQYNLEMAYLDFPSCEHERDKLPMRCWPTLKLKWGNAPRFIRERYSLMAGRRSGWPHLSPPDVVFRLKSAIRFLGGTMANLGHWNSWNLIRMVI
jgi:hypothetical protein